VPVADDLGHRGQGDAGRGGDRAGTGDGERVRQLTSQFTSAQKRVFQRAGIPCVVIDPVDLPDPDVPSVGATNGAGGLAVTRHLAQLGTGGSR
jgi:hypothetical protein